MASMLNMVCSRVPSLCSEGSNVYIAGAAVGVGAITLLATKILGGFYPCSIPQSHVAVLERWGKFERVLEPGLNFYTPGYHSFKNLTGWGTQANKAGWLIEQSEQKMETEKQACQTKDHVTVETTAAIYFKIVDPKKALYEVDVLPEALSDICSKALRSRISTVDLNDLFSKREEISQAVMQDIAKKVNSWGVELLGVEVGQLEFDPAIQEAMKQRRIAEAEQEKQRIESETKSQQAIADAKNILVQAKAEADGKKLVTQAEMGYVTELVNRLGQERATQVLLAGKAREAYSSIAPNAKMVMLPSNFKGMIKLVDGQS